MPVESHRLKFQFFLMAMGAFFVLFLFPQSAGASHCGIVSQATGFLFDNFESAEYVNNFLVLHFKLQVPFPAGERITTNLSFLTDECENATTLAFQGQIFLTPGTQTFSVRFTSHTSFEIWNDDTNTREICPECTQTLFQPFPGYYEVIFRGKSSGSASTLNSSSYRISDIASDPPVKNDTLPIPSACASRPFDAEGILFNPYERTEYVDGLLVYHFRLNPIFNDGRNWFSEIRLHDESCVFFNVAPPNPETFITPWARYYSVRFASPTHYDIWNDETNTKENCPMCSVDFPATLPDGSPYSFVSFFYSVGPTPGNFLTSTPLPVVDPSPSKQEPVIVVPGILGSAEKNGEWVIDPIFHTYDDLLATLEANGYERGKDLFTFPYDWRRSNVLTAMQLRDKINEVQGICGCGKVDLVAHSMGGLVARQYIQSSDYEGDVDQLIFLGTPHLGAPKAYLMWEGGTVGVEFSVPDLLLNAILRQQAIEAGFGSSRPLEVLFNYIRNTSFPILGLKELLPVYDYLRDSDSGVLRNYPVDYPQNEFLEGLNTGQSLGVLEQSGVEITNIFSDSENNTINTIEVKNDISTFPLWEHGIPTSIVRGNGDGTVPPVSSLFLNVLNNSNLNIDSQHDDLPSDASSKVIEILTGKTSIKTVVTSPIKKILSIFGLSPIDFLITAPDGLRIGRNFETSEEINEIENAFYSGFLTNNEFITIPNPLDGEYTVQTKGTDDGGSYTIALEYITEATSTRAEFKSETAPGLINDINFSFASSTPEEIGFKITVEEVIEDIKMASELGWITKSNVRKKLIRELELFARAKEEEQENPEGESDPEKIEEENSDDEKNIPKRIKKFLRILEKDHNKNINDQAYNLLKEDVRLLLLNVL